MKRIELLQKFHDVASNPKAMLEHYINEGKKVVLCAPVYTPEEIVHSFGFVPMSVWGADVELKQAKTYFPAFICSIMQSIVELGINGTYEGAAAIIIPSLCDSLKVTGQNWKYAVPSIPFIPMTYPQNRKPEYAFDFTKAGYERVIHELETITDVKFDDEKLKESIDIYNEHNQVMRTLSDVLAKHPEISAAERSDIFKSAGFMTKEEHTVWVKELIQILDNENSSENRKHRIVISGILADSPSLLSMFDENDFQIVADDVAAQSRQYRTDAPAADNGLERLVLKYQAMDHCSVLYDVEKKRVDLIVQLAKEKSADGVVVVLTKFCDPEEFDYPLIKKACEANDIPVLLIEVDRQMTNYEQARTMLEGFKDILEAM